MSEIITGEVKQYKSSVVNDLSSNGGGMSDLPILTGIKNNVFPDVPQSDLVAGVTQLRKVFHKIENDDDEALYLAQFCLIVVPPGDDEVSLIEGTLSNTQGDLTGSEDEYGIGDLSGDVSAGGSVIVVDVKTASKVFFRTAGTIFIYNGVNYEYFENVTVVQNVTQYTITLDSGDILGYDFDADDTVIAAVVDYGDIITSYTLNQAGVVSVAEYDDTTYPVVLDNIGTNEQTFTITILSGGATFSCVGSLIGSLANGDMLLDYEPSHAKFIKPYFSIDKSGWGVDWAEGDVLVLTTHPATAPIWRKRVVPAGAASYSSDGYKVRMRAQAGGVAETTSSSSTSTSTTTTIT